MRTDFARLSEAALLPEIAAAMDRGHVDDLPVTKPDGAVTGIVRREDLRGHAGGTTAGDVAHHEFEYARYDEPVATVFAQMRAAHLSALPVVTPEGYVEGLVVLDDLATVAPVTARSRWRESARELLLPFGITGDDTVQAATAVGSACLVALALLGITYGAPGWLSGADATAAVVAGVAAATARTPQLLGVALTAFLAAVLAVLWIFARATGVPGWSSWLHLLLAFGFAALTAAAGRLAPRFGGQRP